MLSRQTKISLVKISQKFFFTYLFTCLFPSKTSTLNLDVVLSLASNMLQILSTSHAPGFYSVATMRYLSLMHCSNGNSLSADWCSPPRKELHQQRRRDLPDAMWSVRPQAEQPYSKGWSDQLPVATS